MNTPSSVDEGALDWTGLAHMLALEGTEPARVGRPAGAGVDAR